MIRWLYNETHNNTRQNETKQDGIMQAETKKDKRTRLNQRTLKTSTKEQNWPDKLGQEGQKRKKENVRGLDSNTQQNWTKSKEKIQRETNTRLKKIWQGQMDQDKMKKENKMCSKTGQDGLM